MILNFMFMTILWVPIETFSYWQQTRGFHWVDFYNFEHLVYLSLYLPCCFFFYHRLNTYRSLLKLLGLLLLHPGLRQRQLMSPWYVRTARRGSKFHVVQDLGEQLFLVPVIIFLRFCSCWFVMLSCVLIFAVCSTFFLYFAFFEDISYKIRWFL